MLALALFLNLAYAQSLNCLQLEGINIGCVSSIDHSCFINKTIDKPDSPCNYVADPATMYRVEAPIAFKCKSEISNTVCTKNEGNNDQGGESCVTTSECVEYQPPSCQETCVPCFNKVETHNVGLHRGCIVCTRPRCPDEPISITCPASYNGMPNYKADRCSGDQRCPTQATDPKGKVHDVIITKSSCNPPTLPKIEEPPPPQYCPWKVDKRTTACEPIDPDNKNP